jgi:hypothetical protein
MLGRIMADIVRKSGNWSVGPRDCALENRMVLPLAPSTRLTAMRKSRTSGPLTRSDEVREQFYVDSVSTEDDRLDVPVEYRCWTERRFVQEIAELKAEISRLRGAWRSAQPGYHRLPKPW